MADYILLMHDDGKPVAGGEADWGAYLARLRRLGAFEGGSSIGDGVCVSKAAMAERQESSAIAPALQRMEPGSTAERRERVGITRHLTGYIRVRAASLEEARDLVQGNPVFEAGGTVEIRELPKD
ncbi:MAG: hypothetical protein R3F56_21030 [Planctomycetota bacterium]